MFDDAVLLVAVALLSASQILQKLGATRRLAGSRTVRDWIVALFSLELLAAGVCIVAGTALWLYVLFRMDVSRAFPFLSAGAVLVVAVSRLILGERVSRSRWTGVLLISVGIALVAQT
jgi:drug/metabolite transporter (DMT)-like permease